MRRIQKVFVNPIHVKVHPDLFDKMEELRRQYKQELGISLSQIETSQLLSKKIKVKPPKRLNIIGKKHV